MSDHRALQRELEKRWIEFAWKYLPEALPKGALDQPLPPSPDAVITSSSKTIGVEVSQLVPFSHGRFSNLEIEAAQRRVLKQAQELYERRFGKGLFVNLSFRPGPLPSSRSASHVIAELVEKFRPLPDAFFSALPGRRGTRELLPDWLTGLSIFHEFAHAPAHWVGGSVWSTANLQREQVEQRIAQKASKVQGYRTYTEEVWLLLVCDQASVSADVAIPHEAAEWRFQHPFDRVVLMSMQEFFTY